MRRDISARFEVGNVRAFIIGFANQLQFDKRDTHSHAFRLVCQAVFPRNFVPVSVAKPRFTDFVGLCWMYELQKIFK